MADQPVNRTDTLSKRQQKTRTAFMNALVRLVMQHGYDAVTVTDIAEEANYGRWTFYQYFDSKADAALAVFEGWMMRVDQFVVQAVAGLPSPRREYESWRILFSAFDAQRAFLMRLDSLTVSAWRVRAKDFLIDQFVGHLEAGNFALMPGVRPEIAARLYVAAVLDLLEYWGSHPEMGDVETVLNEFYTFIFNQPPPATDK